MKPAFFMLKMPQNGITAQNLLDVFGLKNNFVESEAQECLVRQKSLPKSEIIKQIDYFYESKDDDID